MGRFLMLQKAVFVRYCVEVWVFPERALVLLVCYTAVFSVVTWGGALRDDTKNGCVADYLMR